MKTCSVEECNNPSHSRGWCRSHYMNWWRHGDPTKISEYVAPKGSDAYRFKHGAWGHPLFSIWSKMLGRCSNPNDAYWHNYGGRGIKVCERWQDPLNFFADMGDRPSMKMSIERLDNSKGYEPGNCAWGYPADQARNRRCVKLTLEKAEAMRKEPRRCLNGRGPGLSRQQIAEKYGVSHATVKKVLSGAYWKPDAPSIARSVEKVAPSIAGALKR